MNALKLFGPESKGKHSYVQRLLFFVVIFGPLFFLSVPTSAYAGSIINRSLYTGLSNGLIAFWTFNGPDTGTFSGIFTAFDKSGNSYNATSTGAATPTLVVGGIGQATQYDGVANYLNTYPIDTSASSVVTVSFWAKYASFPASGAHAFLQMSLNPDSFTDGFWAGFDSVAGCQSSDGKVELYSFGNVGYNTECHTAPSAGQWHHYVAVINRAETVTELTAYIDGQRPTPLSVTRADNSNSFGAEPVLIASNSGSQFFNGSIDDVRIYNRALSTDEIKRLYKMGGTFKINDSRKDTLTSGLVGYWTFDGPDMAGTVAYDKSGQGNNGTLTNGPVRATGKIGQGTSLDGSNDYAQVPANSSLDITDNITLAAWVYRKSAPNKHGVISKVNSGENNAVYELSLGTDNTVEFFSTNGTPVSVLSTGVVSLNTWQHVAATRNGTTVSFYINGVLDSTGTMSGTFGSGGYVLVGAGSQSAGSPINMLNGTIDDARVYNRALSADEVKRLYKMGGTFTINTTRKDTLTEGLIGHWTFDGPDVAGVTAYDRSGNTNSGTLTNGPVRTTGRIGQGLFFNATNNNRVNAGNIGAFDNQTTFTISYWGRRAFDGGTLAVSKGTDTSTRTELVSHSDGNVHFAVSNGSSSFGTVALSDTRWHHFVMVFDGSQADNTTRLKGYIDGVQQTLSFTGTIPATTATVADNVHIGYSVPLNRHSDGTIDDVRVYNRALSADEVKRLYAMGK